MFKIQPATEISGSLNHTVKLHRLADFPNLLNFRFKYVSLLMLEKRFVAIFAVANIQAMKSNDKFCHLFIAVWVRLLIVLCKPGAF